MTDETEAIRRTYDEYFQVFQTLRAEAVAAFCHVPCMALSPQGVVVMTTTEEVRALFRTIRTTLQQRRYGRSEYRELQVKLLSDQMALVSTRVVRYATDGKELEQFGATYLFRKTPTLMLTESVRQAVKSLPLTPAEQAEVFEPESAGWKIAVITIHDPDRV